MWDDPERTKSPKQYSLLAFHNLNIGYSNNTVLITDTEINLQLSLQNVAKESYKKGLNLNCKKIQFMVVRKIIAQHTNYKMEIAK